jgi:antitoxin component YwqK of YwqJK toxin-antitoxin module
MKTKLSLTLVIVFCCAFIPVIAQENGYTNKAEAKNEIKNGYREGKFVVYLDSNFNGIYDSSSAVFYDLMVYKEDKIYGIKRTYHKNGKLYAETPYMNGKVNGILKIYYENGTLQREVSITNGEKNGVSKEFYKNGQVQYQYSYSHDKVNGEVKEYYEDGKLKYEETEVDGKPNGKGKSYDESGNEIKQ